MLNVTIKPSHASRWMQCAGSPALIATLPKEQSNDDALEGLAAHHLGEQVLKSWHQFGEAIHTPQSYLNHVVINNVVVNEEMIEAADIYVMDVLKVAQKHGALQSLRVEKEVNPVDLIHPINKGKIDSYIILTDECKLIVWDFKYGQGVVDVFENWQMINYVAGILQAEFIDNDLQIPGNLQVEMRIVQPRAYDAAGIIRSWSLGISELNDYIYAMHSQAAVVMSGQGACQTGHACKRCPARHICPALLKASHMFLEVASDATPLNLPVEALANEVKMLQRARDHIKWRLESLEAEAINKMEHGGAVPGFDLKINYGRYFWNVPIEEVEAVGALFNVELTETTTNTISPAKAKKLVDASVISAYIDRKVSSKQLKPINPKKAREVFNDTIK